MTMRVFHPFLLSVYPVLYLLSKNLGEVPLEHVMRSTFVLVAASACLFLILALVSRNAPLAGLRTSLFLVFLFSPAGLEELEARFGALDAAWGLALVASALTALALLAGRLVENWSRFTRVLNVGAAALCVLPLSQIGMYLAQPREEAVPDVATVHPMAVDAGFETPPGTLPDIYYIVLDAYTRADTLRKFYDYDNSEFVAFLRRKGFSVAEKSFSNYTHTRAVVPAVLNFEYVDPGASSAGHESTDTASLTRRTYHNKVVSILKAQGYRIVNIMSGPGFVSVADAERIRLKSPREFTNEFEQALMQMTWLPSLSQIPPTSSRSERQSVDRELVEFAIAKLAAQPETPGPKFVFAHIKSPHAPFVFGPRGEPRDLRLRYFVEHSPLELRTYMQAYADQVHYLNVLMKDVIERILSDSETPPVVVLQGDHGLRLFGSRDVEETCLTESFSILNAFHLPGKDGASRFYESISPVNTFRLIFDTYFGSSLGLLQDRSYHTSRDDFGIFRFADVTQRVDSCAPLWRERLRGLRE